MHPKILIGAQCYCTKFHRTFIFSSKMNIFIYQMNHEIIRNESFYGVCITKINFVLGILQTISKYLNEKTFDHELRQKSPKLSCMTIIKIILSVIV